MQNPKFNRESSAYKYDEHSRFSRSAPQTTGRFGSADGARSPRYENRTAGSVRSVSGGTTRPQARPSGGVAQRRPAPQSSSAPQRRSPSPQQNRSRSAAPAMRRSPSPQQNRSRSAAPAMRRAPHRRKPTFRQRLKRLQRRHPWMLPAMLVLLVLAIALPLIFTGGGKPAPEAVPTAAPTAVPTQAPAATHTPEPTQPPATKAPVPTMVPDYEFVDGTNIPNTKQALGLPEGPRVDDSFFNNTVFVGDSISEKLRRFVHSERRENPTLLGDAKFLTAASFSARNALKGITETSLHPTYQGVKMTLEDAIAAMNVDKVYLMLGLNDVGISGAEAAAENMLELLRRIKEKNPDVVIFLQSATPRLSGDNPTTNQLFKYNLLMYEHMPSLAESGIYYLDVAYIMRDDQGKLIEEYCSDADSMALHFNNEGCRKWIDFLYTHAYDVSGAPGAADKENVI